jgi:DNA mismatch repair ATPase MutS
MNSKHFIIAAENLANCSFRLADSPMAAELKAKLNELAIKVAEEEGFVQIELTRKLKEQFETIEQAWNSCAELAWDYSLAQFALRYHCCIPRITANFEGIKISQAVNLPLKLFLQENDRDYQSLDIRLNTKANLFTGPNMGGKTSALITLGQMCYLAMLAIPLPATEATVFIYDEVYYNHDRGDNSETLSSFGREVVSLTQMLQRSGTKLILLDEFAKGTNPTEGEAICVAVLKYLLTTQHTVVAATHYTAPTLLKGLAHYYIKGIAPESFMALQNIKDTDLETRLKLLSQAMDYSLELSLGSSIPAKCAVSIARILGLPEAILSLLKEDEACQI